MIILNPEILLPILLGGLALYLTARAWGNWHGGKYLCEDCRFNNDVDCKKSERPRAVICLAFRKRSGS